MPVSISLQPAAGLNDWITRFEEATGELGIVAKDYGLKAKSTHSPVVLMVASAFPLGDRVTIKAVDDFRDGKPMPAPIEKPPEAGIVLANPPQQSFLDHLMQPVADHVDAFMAQAAQADAALAKERDELGRWQNFHYSPVAKANYLGMTGALGCDHAYYLANRNVVAALKEQGLISDEQVKQLDELLPVAAKPSHTAIAKMEEYGLINDKTKRALTMLSFKDPPQAGLGR